MTTVNDFYNYLDETAPFSAQESWDNSGLLVGSDEKEVQRVALTLDLNNQTFSQAISLEADLIITHHPVIFKPQKNFLSGNMAYELAKNDISLISSHTCFDCAYGGVNDILCDFLGLSRVETVSSDSGENILRAGFIDKMNSGNFARYVSKQLNANVRCGLLDKEIETVAVCSGAGADFIEQVGEMGIDAFVTGDASHHDFLDAEQAGVFLVAAGHFETENPAMSVLAGRLRAEFPETEIIVLSEENPIKYIQG